MSPPEGILILAYGNPGRLDDGLGPAAAALLEKMAIGGVTIDCDYQLTVECAADVARHEVVIFVDAAVRGREPFYFEQLYAKEDAGVSTHSVSPEAVLQFAKTAFQAEPPAYVLGIRGYEFNAFGEGLSEKAANGLAEAMEFLVRLLQERDFEAATHKYTN